MWELARLSYPEVASLLEQGVDTVVLPVGTLEPHGAHLPVGTDALVAEALARRVAGMIGAVLLPTVYYGVTGSMYGYPGAVRVEPQVLEALVTQVLRGMRRNGFSYALVINGHGGSGQVGALNEAARKVWYEDRMPVMVVDWWVLARDRGVTKEVLGRVGGHAGADETAMVAACCPTLVKAGDHTPSEEYIHTSGIRAYPLPGTVIHYGEGEEIEVGEEAEEFFERVAELIVDEWRRFRERAAGLVGP